MKESTIIEIPSIFLEWEKLEEILCREELILHKCLPAIEDDFFYWLGDF